MFPLRVVRPGEQVRDVLIATPGTGSGAPEHCSRPAAQVLHDRAAALASVGVTGDAPASHLRTGCSDGAASVLTGDTVLGRASTVIAHPDGRLRDYLASLCRLAELPPGVTVLPGHGPDLPDAIVYADVDPVLWPAADVSVAAQLQFLRDG